MNHKSLSAAAILLACVIVIGFLLSVPRVSEAPNAADLQTRGATIPPVTLRDTFKKGVHTLSGSVLAPNACTEVSASATLLSDASSTPGIALALTTSAGDGVCLQLPTAVPFSTSISGVAGVPVVVTVNGSVATTTTP